MLIRSDSFSDGARIPARLALGEPDPDTHVTFAGNRSPHLAWSGLPEGTRSLALIVLDRDVPSVGDDVNQEGRTVPADLPRVPFYHWVLVNIPVSRTSFSEGEFSEGVTAHGKDAAGRDGMQPGVNDYTGWFAGDEDMEGDYFGYDGPCPPWNDSIVHHYEFTLYALDVDRVEVQGAFGGADALAAIEGHVLDKAALMGTYTINPEAEER